MVNRSKILSLEIDQVSFSQSLNKVKQLAKNHTPSYVCFANVHMTIEAYRDKQFAHKVNSATLVLADGNPIAKSFQFLYNKKQERIAGMDFMPRILEHINTGEFKIFLYGSTNEELKALKKSINEKYNQIEIAGIISPPFRALTQTEQEMYVQQINDSGTHIVFVALGCPKQEKWMYDFHKKINAVCLGVGGAFGTVAGIQKRAPLWMQQLSLEWTYRLAQEPKRLFKRYFITNTLFIGLLIVAIAKKKLYGRK